MLFIGSVIFRLYCLLRLWSRGPLLVCVFPNDKGFQCGVVWYCLAMRDITTSLILEHRVKCDLSKHGKMIYTLIVKVVTSQHSNSSLMQNNENGVVLILIFLIHCFWITTFVIHMNMFEPITWMLIRSYKYVIISILYPINT